MKACVKVGPHYTGGYYFRIFTTHSEDTSNDYKKYDVLHFMSGRYDTPVQATQAGYQRAKQDGYTVVGYHTKIKRETP